MPAIAPCLWFDSEAEEAANFYVSVFPSSRITRIARYGREGFEIHGKPAGSVMTVEFVLDGKPFLALNGGPVYRFTEAISLKVDCASQGELDYYWSRLSDGGDPKAQVCGWLKDRYGVSWQIVPAILATLMGDGDPARSERVMKAVLGMKKLDIAALERAAKGA